MTYSKAKLKSSGDRASHCFRPFWIGKLSHKCLPIRTLLYVSFKHILINLTSFMGTPNFMRVLYKTSPLNESWALLKSMNSLYTVSCPHFVRLLKFMIKNKKYCYTFRLTYYNHNNILRQNSHTPFLKLESVSMYTHTNIIHLVALSLTALL
jgi:hypothetical protein